MTFRYASPFRLTVFSQRQEQKISVRDLMLPLTIAHAAMPLVQSSLFTSSSVIHREMKSDDDCWSEKMFVRSQRLVRVSSTWHMTQRLFVEFFMSCRVLGVFEKFRVVTENKNISKLNKKKSRLK
jgi:hypothetical protein